MLKLPNWSLLHFADQKISCTRWPERQSVGWIMPLEFWSCCQEEILHSMNLIWRLFPWVLIEIWPWILHYFDQLSLIDTKSLEVRSQSLTLQFMTCLNFEWQPMIASFWNDLEPIHFVNVYLRVVTWMDSSFYLDPTSRFIVDLICIHHSAYDWLWDVLTLWLLWMMS